MYRLMKVTLIPFLTFIINSNALAKLEIENDIRIQDSNIKYLVDKPLKSGMTVIGMICCNSNSLKGGPILRRYSVDFTLRVPLGASVRYFHVPAKSYAKFTCDKQSVGCMRPFEIASNLEPSLDKGIRVENQCDVDNPKITFESDNAFIGFKMLKGSSTVDGVDGTFSCDKPSRRVKK